MEDRYKKSINEVNELSGKNILLLAPKYFGYDVEIKNELENFGTNVFLYDERPKNNFVTKVLLRLNLKLLIQKKINAYYDNIIDETKEKKLDYLFLVNAETIDASRIDIIKKLHSNIKIYTYMWDSVKNKKKSMQYIEVSDKFFTFDPNDIKSNENIKFLPLFFIQDYEKLVNNNVIKYDIAFVGTIHSDRYQVIQTMQTNGLKVFYYFFSPSKILFKLQRILYKNFKQITPNHISFQFLRKEELLSILSQSKAVIDIEHPDQKGLTMRTIEMLGAKKKLITTNQHIREYDFYTPENICIIDRKNPIVSNSFFESEYKELSQEVYEKYALRNWLKEIFIVD